MNTDQPTDQKTIAELEEQFAREILRKGYHALDGEVPSTATAYLTLQKAILLRKVNELASREAIEGLVDRAVDRAFEKAKDERASNAGGEQ